MIVYTSRVNLPKRNCVCSLSGLLEVIMREIPHLLTISKSHHSNLDRAAGRSKESASSKRSTIRP